MDDNTLPSPEEDEIVGSKASGDARKASGNTDPFAELKQVQTQEEVSFAGEGFDEFLADLETLHIPDNRSGRLHFAKKWPAPAAFLFGDVLTEMDRDGVPDKEARAKLEHAAVLRQHDLLEVAYHYMDKSVDSGSLQLGFVKSLIQSLGREIGLIFYRADIVERVLPSPQEASEQEEKLEPESEPEPVQEPEPEPKPEPETKPTEVKSSPLGLRITGESSDT